MREKYVPSGEGYWHVGGDPSKGFYGIPHEIEESLNQEFELKKQREDLIVSNAMKLIRQSDSRDVNYKVHLLKKLGHSNLKITGGVISLDNLDKKYHPNLTNMYNRVVNQLKEIVKHPNKESKLVDRLLQ